MDWGQFIALKGKFSIKTGNSLPNQVSIPAIFG